MLKFTMLNFARKMLAICVKFVHKLFYQILIQLNMVFIVTLTALKLRLRQYLEEDCSLSFDL